MRTWTVTIPGEEFRCLVRSRTDRKKRYLVDMEANGWHGECDCTDFRCNRKKFIGKRPESKTRCWHIEQARKEWQEDRMPVLCHLMDHHQYGELLRKMLWWAEADMALGRKARA